MYSISCYIDKVIVNKNGINSITIRPTGRCRVEGNDTQCLGFYCEKEQVEQVKMFPREVSVAPKRKDSVALQMSDVILMARICGKEVELKLNEGKRVEEIVV